MTYLKPYKMYLIVIGYLLLLRVVLFFTVDMAVRPLGLFYDMVVMMFWVGVVAYFISSRVYQKVWYLFVVIMSSIFTIVDSVYYDYFGVIFARSSVSGLKWLQEGNTLEYDITIPLVAYLITPILLLVGYLIISNKKADVFSFKHFAPVVAIFIAQVGLFLFWGNQQFEEKIEYYRSNYIRNYSGSYGVSAD